MHLNVYKCWEVEPSTIAFGQSKLEPPMKCSQGIYLGIREGGYIIWGFAEAAS